SRGRTAWSGWDWPSASGGCADVRSVRTRWPPISAPSSGTASPGWPPITASTSAITPHCPRETSVHEPQEEYDGPATIDSEQPVPVRVRLRGHLEPIDGRFHWYGRIDADDLLSARHSSGDRVSLSTP